jgi:crossover junction endodeoxyribonuclease RuvC
MVILGIDPGSRATGYGIIESRDGRLRPIGYGILRPPVAGNYLERLPHLEAAVASLLDRHTPGCVAIEDVFHARNSRAALLLGHARAVALLPALRRSLPVATYAARLVKKAVAGHGGAEKDQVRRMVRLLLNLPREPLALDASDALAVAICHAHTAALARRVRVEQPAAGRRPALQRRLQTT